MDGLHLVLLMLLLATLYVCALLRAEARRAYNDGWFSGHQHATQRFLVPHQPLRDAWWLTDQPYDWQTEGL